MGEVEKQGLGSSNIRIGTPFDWQAVIDGLPQCILWKDAQSRFLGCNSAFAQTLGLASPADIIGKTDHDMPWAGVQAEKYIADDMQVLQTQQPMLDYEELQRQPDGSLHVTLVSKMPLQLGDGEIGILCIYRDVTERKQMLQDLSSAKAAAEQASRAKSRFLSTISHEMKTPLNAIKGGLDLLVNWCEEPKQQALAHTLLEASDHLLSLVNDVMHTVRSDHYDVSLKNNPASARQLTQQCYDHACMHVDKKDSVDCRLIIDPEVMKLPVLSMDTLRISQVLKNLLDNAIKFTQSGFVSLRVSCKQRTTEEAQICWQVQDSGCGISEDRLEDIFEPFSQVTGDSEYYSKGYGLGLSICRYFSEILGGRLHVKSELGSGSSFSFTCDFALADADAILDSSQLEAIGLAQQAIAPRSMADMQVLLVEDSIINQKIVAALLQECGVIVDVAGNATEAKKFLKSKEYMFILMDIGLPGQDGISLSQSIKEHDKSQLIYALTARDVQTQKEGVLDIFEKVLQKPIGLQVVQDLVAKHR